MTLSHAQFKDLDERKFKLWSKKLAKNPSYPCPISSVYDAYPVEIEKRKNGAKTEYVISIDNESEPVPLTKEELTALMGAPRIPESSTATPVIIWEPPSSSSNSATVSTACRSWRRMK